MGGEKITGAVGDQRPRPPNKNPTGFTSNTSFPEAVAGPQHEVVAASRIKMGILFKQTSLEFRVHRFVFVCGFAGVEFWMAFSGVPPSD